MRETTQDSNEIMPESLTPRRHAISPHDQKFFALPPPRTALVLHLSATLASKPIRHTHASVAQLVEQLTLNQLVLGSNPSRGTKRPLWGGDR